MLSEDYRYKEEMIIEIFNEATYNNQYNIMKK